MFPQAFPSADYDDLQTKEVTIAAFRYHRGDRSGSNYYYFRTTDGEKYNISGDYDSAELKAVMRTGRTITIKWYQNKPFATLLAEEIYVDGQQLVSYDNDEPFDAKPPLIVGSCFFAVGIGGFLLLGVFVRANQNKQNKRDERIRKKYGKIKE